MLWPKAEGNSPDMNYTIFQPRQLGFISLLPFPPSFITILREIRLVEDGTQIIIRKTDGNSGVWGEERAFNEF